jgi:3D-(3,5/4)-trihydroxycyclohexane-1,2-dione acylhydrolase (decyclizing)
MLGLKLIIVVLDNGGFGCINRLQQATGGAPFNNLFETARHAALPEIDLARHAASLGATAEKVANLAELEAALERARAADRTYAIVIETDPAAATAAGGAWWDVAVPEASPRPEARDLRAAYEAARDKQRLGD